jgi:hypothetical protein
VVFAVEAAEAVLPWPARRYAPIAIIITIITTIPMIPAVFMQSDTFCTLDYLSFSPGKERSTAPLAG